MPSRAVLMSIRPRFAQGILAGEKTVELRRRAPRVEPGDVVVIYETSPTKAIVGWTKVEAVETAAPAALWAKVEDDAGVSRREFDEYFAGSPSATAIRLVDVMALATPIKLDAIRMRWPWLRPPQSYRYVSVAHSNAGITRLAPAAF